MKKLFLLFAWIVITGGLSFAQSPDEIYRKPLKVVLNDVEKRFNVKLSYDDKIVKDKVVSFAYWRMKSDVESTLNSILGPQDLVFSKNASGVYEISPFQYHKRTVEEGRKHLEKLLSLYPDLQSWQQRKQEVQECIRTTLLLNSFPPKNPLNPIFTPKRKYEGYTTENVALETLPGVYLCGTLYKPLKKKPPYPAVLLAQGHFENQHYEEHTQMLGATLARMGAVVFSYDMFAKCESLLQFAFEDHRTAIAPPMQTWNTLRVVDFLTSMSGIDSTRIAMTGASGGGTQTFLATALDSRIRVSVPVVMVSSWFFGGCPCESSLPIHSCGEWGTNNVEIAALAAPRPMILISDGGDWTSTTPDLEFPYIQKIYGLYGKSGIVENVHLPDEVHDYGPSKRDAAIRFLARHLNLDMQPVLDPTGKIDESKCTLESKSGMLVFGEKGEKLPANAIHGLASLKKLLNWPYK
jgi:dienelactone hydrolase